MTVQWPGAAVNDGGLDLSAPLVGLLQQLNVLEKERELEVGPTAFGGTPASLQVITAGATSVTKWVSGIITALGGGATVWAALKGFWITTSEVQRVAYIAAAAVVGSSLAIALALIVRSDVSARAVASAAEYAARAGVAKTFLETTVAAAGTRYLLKRRGSDNWIPVTCFQQDPGLGLLAVTASDRIRADEIEGLVEVPSS